jgi:hypothetical protein
MNPSAKAAGLSFQLSSPMENRDGSIFEQRSDVRRHDGRPAGSFAADSQGTRVCSHSDCKYFTRRNLASIRFSRYVAVCSRSEAA